MTRCRSKPKKKNSRFVVALAVLSTMAGAFWIAQSWHPRAAPPWSAASGRVPFRSDAGGMTAAVDPQTGQIRQPTPEEQQELAAGQLVTVTEAQATTAVDGSPAMLLPDQYMTFTVATRNADGIVSVQHVTDRKAADAAVAGKTPSGPLGRKEALRDR